MASIISAKKSKRGRPPVDTEAVNVRLHRQVLADIDAWRREQDDLPTRPEAIRRLTELGLTTVQKKATQIPSGALVWLKRKIDRAGGQHIMNRFSEQFSAMKQPKGMLMVIHHASQTEDRLYVRVPEASRQSYPHFRRIMEADIPAAIEFVAGDERSFQDRPSIKTRK